MQDQPRIGITTDFKDDRFSVGRFYSQHVLSCGGLPILLPLHQELASSFASLCDGLILTGGDDPIMESFGEATRHIVRPGRSPLSGSGSNFAFCRYSTIGLIFPCWACAWACSTWRCMPAVA